MTIVTARVEELYDGSGAATTRYDLDGSALVVTTRFDVGDGAVVVRDVCLPEATEVIVPTGLGCSPRIVHVSAPRGALANGRIEAARPPLGDRLVLTAHGYGATVVVDMLVRP